ncbi:MAG: aminotransferase class V-fold PLP-dependent enzyme [Chloroflexi bacterium]|nr:aminotransferase class V-fold PLP-dependent enzyme [Chloroflexota bacterium]
MPDAAARHPRSSATALRDLFQLDPQIGFLNHGSFGATPKPVFAVYQDWQRRLERQPVQFFTAELPKLLAEARAVLAAYVNAEPDDLVYIPNATFGVNVIARSLQLGPGDEVLTTDHEYGACDNVWTFLSHKRGFSYRRQEISLPVRLSEEIVEQFWRGVTPRVKVIFISHITSATAVRFPVEAICARARKAGILTVVDGAHAVGQIPLDMAAVGADFYVSNAHKWLCSPKGSAFLYARRQRQQLIEPLAVSWGWGENRDFSYGSDFLNYLQWMGTSDQSAYLSVPAAIEFQKEYQWTAVRQRCQDLLRGALRRIGDLTGLPPAYPDGAGFYRQMGIAPLPPIDDLPAFKARLYDEFSVEAPCTQWRDRQFIRISVQGYNTQTDIDALLAALRTMLG